MIIDGGVLFVMEDDQLPRVTIRGARVVVDAADTSLEGMQDFLCERICGGSFITHCTFFTLAQWSEKRTGKIVGRIGAEAGRDAKPDTRLGLAVKRLRRALGMEA